MTDIRKGYIQGVCSSLAVLLRTFGNTREARRVWSVHQFTLSDIERAGVPTEDAITITQNFVLK